MQKMPPDCTQERVFCERTPSKRPKNFRLRRAQNLIFERFSPLEISNFSFQKFVKKSLKNKTFSIFPKRSKMRFLKDLRFRIFSQQTPLR